MTKTNIQAGKPIDIDDIVLVQASDGAKYVGVMKGIHLTSRAVLLTKGLLLGKNNIVYKEVPSTYLLALKSDAFYIMDSIQLFDVSHIMNITKQTKEEAKKTKSLKKENK